MARILPSARPPLRRLVSRLLLGLATACGLAAAARAQEGAAPRFVDLSLLVAPEYPCTWPTFPRFQINHYQAASAPLSAYNSDILIIDGNTGTQLDVPAAFGHAARFGAAQRRAVRPGVHRHGPRLAVRRRGVRHRLPRPARRGRPRPQPPDRARSGSSPGRRSIGRSAPATWCCSTAATATGTTSPLPEGRRFAADPVEGKAPAWPGPDPDCMEYLAGRKVMTLGIDSTSMGPLPDLAEPTHFAGLKHGMIWTESADRPGPAAADRRVLLHARPQARRRHLQRRRGPSPSSATRWPGG